MSAVAIQQRREQEPSGPGHEMMEEWTLWYRDKPPGEHHSWAVKERIDICHDEEPPLRAQRVDRAVARLGIDFPQYPKIVKMYYWERRSYWEIAGRLRYTSGFVRMSVQAVCDHVVRVLDKS